MKPRPEAPKVLQIDWSNKNRDNHQSADGSSNQNECRTQSEMRQAATIILGGRILQKAAELVRNHILQHPSQDNMRQTFFFQEGSHCSQAQPFNHNIP
jgi:hypothetical protein